MALVLNPVLFYPHNMHLLDIIHRSPKPIPWSEGEKIPWNDPAFSARMLKEHLSQTHDLGSRRAAKIDQQVAWIHQVLLAEKPTQILDLGCGPGLYTSRLAQLGHTCTGIDYSPASIAYAAAFAADESNGQRLPCTYHQQDIRKAEYGKNYGLVMLIFGELNIFRLTDAIAILKKANVALEPGGLLLLEVHSEASVKQMGQAGSSWYSSTGGLFSEKNHLCLTENSWDESTATATRRFFIVDATTGNIAPYAFSAQAYTPDEYFELLTKAGFCDIAWYQSLTGAPDETQTEFFVLTARKPGEEF